MKLKNIISLTIAAIICVMISLAGQSSPWSVMLDNLGSSMSSPQQDSMNTPTSDPEMKIVDYEADRIYKARGDSAIRLVGNVIFHHNGAIIQCDSAYRYDEKRMDCFGNVIINQDSTYIYGDIASYDGNTNMAYVYAPLIKLVHSDAVLYTYNLSYNTKTSIGKYTNGGAMSQKTNYMESESGVYNGNLSTVKFLNSVAMRNENYEIKTDSANFNINTEIFTFLARSYIWDNERDFMMADKGNYNSKNQIYTFTKNAYIMTPDNEVWADSLRYYSMTKEVYMERNVQILDTVQKSIALGDWAYYNDSLKNALLTIKPAILTYQNQDNEDDKNLSANAKVDTTYMRADSIFLYTFGPGMSRFVPDEFPDEENTAAFVADSALNLERIKDSLSFIESQKLNSDSISAADGAIIDSISQMADAQIDSLEQIDNQALNNADSLINITDSLIVNQIQTADSVQNNNKTDERLKENQTKRSRRKKDKKNRKNQNKEDQININSEEIILKSADQIDVISMEEVEITRKKNRRKKNNKTNNNNFEPVAKIDSLSIDSLALDLLNTADSILGDSTLIIDSLTDSLSTLSPKPLTDTTSRDTMERVIRAYHKVMVYKSDVQMVADSVVGFSVDSITNYYGRPILWSDQNQITSDRIDMYMSNDELDWADFVGSPFVTQQVDDTLFNQASGKEMRVYFKNNSVDIAEIEGNVMNYYYMEDEDSMLIAFATITCAQLEMTFENQEPTKMKWTGQPEWVIYPITDIPASQNQKLEGFSWSPNLRPANRETITTRQIIKSNRSVASRFKRPIFDITSKINSYKNNLLMRGTWSDRTDLPLVTADYFENRDLDF